MGGGAVERMVEAVGRVKEDKEQHGTGRRSLYSSSTVSATTFGSGSPRFSGTVVSLLANADEPLSSGARDQIRITDLTSSDLCEVTLPATPSDQDWAMTLVLDAT